MGTLIDTSVLIAVERGEIALEAIADNEEEIALAAVTASELLHGVYRAQTPTQRNRRQAFVEGLLTEVPVLAFDLTAARIHASLWADLAKRGISIGERDLMIGATAIAGDYGVATRNDRSFSKIPGLRVRLL